MPRKIAVMGTTGAGKSTFAAEIARRLDLPCIELDELHWGPNWTAAEPPEFQERLRQQMALAPEGWVIDGNYHSKLGDTVTGSADTLVWLDLPFPVKAFRLWRRTLARVRGEVELWNGNRERWREVFLTRDSLFIWLIRTHRRHKREWPAKFGGDPRFIRLRSAAAARRWLEELSSGRDGERDAVSRPPGADSDSLSEAHWDAALDLTLRTSIETGEEPLARHP